MTTLELFVSISPISVSKAPEPTHHARRAAKPKTGSETPRISRIAAREPSADNNVSTASLLR